MRTTGNGFFFIAPVRVRVEVISYTCRLLIFKNVASSCTVKISIDLTLAKPRTWSLLGRTFVNFMSKPSPAVLNRALPASVG
jgi:hypothetical protein